MTDYSKAFNDLPADVRKICAVEETKMRINQIKIDIEKVNRNHDRVIREMNAQLNNLYEWIKANA